MTRRMTSAEKWTVFVLLAMFVIGDTVAIRIWHHETWATVARAAWLLATSVCCLYINERSTYSSPFYKEK